jgi:hypothetical protein
VQDPTATDLAKGGRYADYTLTVDASVPGVEFASPNGKLMLWCVCVGVCACAPPVSSF